MRTLIVAILACLAVFSLGCEELEQISESGEREVQATPVSPVPPEQPERPKAASKSGALPDTPRPAATPEPADTPVPVGTPLAVLPSYTPEPTATVVPRATEVPVSAKSVDEKREEYIARCKHWALRNMKPIEYSRFEQLDPYSMTDLERVLWGSVIVSSERVNDVDSYYDNNADYGVFRFRSEHIEWCQDYWSEPLSRTNANKRNHVAWQLNCQAGLPGEARNLEDNLDRAFEQYESEGMSPVIVNQYARILNWVEIDGETLLQVEPKPCDIVRIVWDRGDDEPSRYRERNRIGDWPLSTSSEEDIEWWHIEQAWGSDWRDCKNYYPQLFFGRWVPLDDFGFVDEKWLREAQESFEDHRARDDDWPDWADGPDREILIRLE